MRDCTQMDTCGCGCSNVTRKHLNLRQLVLCVQPSSILWVFYRPCIFLVDFPPLPPLFSVLVKMEQDAEMM